MKKLTNLPPTVALVVERFRNAMLADDTLDDKVAERLIKEIHAKGAVTPAKINAAMFPDQTIKADESK